MFLLLNITKFPSASFLCSIVEKIKVLDNCDGKEFSKSVIFLHCVRNVTEMNYQISNIVNYVIGLYRKHLLHKNEQETVLSFSQQLVVIQIVLNQLCMEQPSMVEIKNILNKIIERKLQNFQNQENENSTLDDLLSIDPADKLLRKSDSSKNFEQIFNGYKEFLSNSNVVDFVDVLKSLSLELSMNSELLTKEDAIVLINNGSLSQAEELIITHLLRFIGNYFTITTSHEDHPIVIPSSQSEILDNIRNGENHFVKSSSSSPSQAYAEHLMHSYLTLLINSRSELALATVINVPERGIDHHGFTEVKHAAASKNLSMYQTITSFVLRSRLGGKGYAPGSDDPLTQMLKGLSEFTDLYNKMHSIIEEDIDIRSATTRLVKLIKNTLCKASQSVSLSSPPPKSVSSHFLRPIRRGDLDAAATKILSAFESQFKSLESTDLDNATPTRMISEGASVNGRRTLRMIRDVLDLHATHGGDDNDDDKVLVVDVVLTQTGSTPMRSLPSLASKFKSPDDATKSSWRRLFAQNKDTNVGFKRHKSTPNKSTPKQSKKPRPLFSRSFSSPSENKENIPPEIPLQRQPDLPPAHPSTKAAIQTQVQKKPTAKKVQRTSKRSLFKNSDKTQTTLKQFFR